MRLPPGPGRCRQRAAADAARFPESFPRPAGTPKDRSRPGPPPGASVSGPGHSAFRPRHLRRMVRRLAVQAAPADRTFRPPRRPEVPFHSGRTFRPAQTGGSVPCRPHNSAPRRPDVPPAVGRPCSARRIAPMRRYGHKKTGTAAHSLRRGRHKKNGTAAHTRPRKGNRIS